MELFQSILIIVSVAFTAIGLIYFLSQLGGLVGRNVIAPAITWCLLAWRKKFRTKRTFKVKATLFTDETPFTYQISGYNINIYNAEKRAIHLMHTFIVYNERCINNKQDVFAIGLKDLLRFKQQPVVKILSIVEVTKS
jgi:hypothetical protein